MTFDPKHLMQLAAIIGAGSLGRAAERLGMAQPALSRNIRIMDPGRVHAFLRIKLISQHPILFLRSHKLEEGLRSLRSMLRTSIEEV